MLVKMNLYNVHEINQFPIWIIQCIVKVEMSKTTFLLALKVKARASWKKLVGSLARPLSKAAGGPVKLSYFTIYI